MSSRTIPNSGRINLRDWKWDGILQFDAMMISVLTFVNKTQNKHRAEQQQTQRMKQKKNPTKENYSHICWRFFWKKLVR